MLLAGVVISISLGLATLYSERNKVSEAALEESLQRFKWFISLYGPFLSDPGRIDSGTLGMYLLKFRDSQLRSLIGQAVYISVFKPDGKRLTEFFDDSYKLIPEVKRAATRMFPDALEIDSVRYKIIRLDGVPHMKIDMTIEDAGGKPVSIIESIFAFSDETIRGFRFRALRFTGYIMLAVMLTTAFLYPVIRRLMQRVTDYSISLLDANIGTLETLGDAIAMRDSDTDAHNYRVTIYATYLGERIGLPPRIMRALIKGSFLHDVGKIGTPDRILLKPEQLNENEFKIMKAHVNNGRDIVMRSRWLHDAAQIVYSHHERVDGTGLSVRTCRKRYPAHCTDICNCGRL
jgi:HD-GYP domain-containing protein (c-di-GMP phosphodiesterase class II)